MRALSKLAPAPGVAFRDVAPPPAPGPGDVVVDVAAACVCGTDLHIFEWSPAYAFMAPALPVTLGHEFAGRVAAVGPGVTGLAPGALVAVRPSVVCGRCDACRSGDDERCATRRGIGVTRDGGFAAQAGVPAANCVPVPDGVPAEVAALTEPMTVSAEAVIRGGVAPGMRVLVLGPGTIGQGAALFAREAGAREVVVAGRHDAPRLAALRAMGFDATVDVGEGTLADALGPHGRAPFDVVIEAAGAPSIVAPAQALLARRGTLVVCGIHERPAPVDMVRLVREQQTLVGSYRAPVETWPRVLAFLRDQVAAARTMISHKLPLERALEGFELARSRVASKVVLLP